MSSQNPVFIPGPTNIPERLRHAVQRADDRPPLGELRRDVQAALRRREEGPEDQRRRGHPLPRHRHRRLGGGDLQHAVARATRSSPAATACSRTAGSTCASATASTSSSSTPPGAPAPPRPSSRPRSRPTRTTRSRPSSSPTTRPRPASAPTSPPSARRWTPRSTRRSSSSTASARSARMDFRMDEWGVDVAVTGSQKGFMLPDRPRHRRRQPEGARRRWRRRSCRAASSTSATC